MFNLAEEVIEAHGGLARWQATESVSMGLWAGGVEVFAPTRLTYTFRWEDPDPDDQETIVRLSLQLMAGRTRMSLWQGPFVTEARLALHRRGWTDSIQKLTELLR